jgi:hypothetical protein
LLLPFSFVLATFFGIIFPSANVVELKVKISDASAAVLTNPNAIVAAAAANFTNMAFPPCCRIAATAPPRSATTPLDGG